METNLTRAAMAAAEVLAARLETASQRGNSKSSVSIHADDTGARFTCLSASLHEEAFGSRLRAPGMGIAQIAAQSGDAMCAAIAECLREDLI